MLMIRTAKVAVYNDELAQTSTYECDTCDYMDVIAELTLQPSRRFDLWQEKRLLGCSSRGISKFISKKIKMIFFTF